MLLSFYRREFTYGTFSGLLCWIKKARWASHRAGIVDDPPDQQVQVHVAPPFVPLKIYRVETRAMNSNRDNDEKKKKLDQKAGGKKKKHT